MGEITNLRQFKKQKALKLKEQQTHDNRVKFGRTKWQKQYDEAIKEKTEKFFEHNKIEPDKGHND